MLEEKNDNLPLADGQAAPETTGLTSDLQEQNSAADTAAQPQTVGVSSEGQPFDPSEVHVPAEPNQDTEIPLISATEGQPIGIDALIEEEITLLAAEAVAKEEAAPEIESETQPEDEIAETAREVMAAHPEIDDVAELVHHVEILDHEEYERQQTAENELLDAVAAIENSNATDAEHDELHETPLHDYESMTMEELAERLDEIVHGEKALSMKRHVDEIRKTFMGHFHKFLEEKREAFHRENPETTEDFHYSFPLKSKFDNLLHKFRDMKSAQFKSMQSNLETNLKTRLEIVDEIKNLINPQENIKDTLKHFNELRERWKNAGPIPKDKYNHVWNNYHFHVENFYDYLHLDREARDMDFRHNLEQKQKLIDRAKALLDAPEVNRAFRELQALHKIWKEDIGPVSKEHREEIWNQFSEITRQMHEKREGILATLRQSENYNLDKKRGIIAQIEALIAEPVTSHNGWLQHMAKVDALRNEFFATGRVPADENEATWNAFKQAVRAFNAAKNNFYKDIKRDQSENLNRKQELVARAKELESSDDFAHTTPIMKQIQEEWKTIGHVPRKYSDQLWKEFKDACNRYFERLKEVRSSGTPEEADAYEKKKSYLETLRSFELTGDHKSDLAAIKAHIEAWKTFGRVPEAKRHIEGKFNKILDALFEKLSLSKKEGEMMRFSNKLEQLAGSDDSRKLENEKIFLQRKIEEVQGEIFQLENNIQFFASAKKENPMIAEVRRNIERHKDQLEMLKEKLKQIRQIRAE